jgi:hypothetical protein
VTNRDSVLRDRKEVSHKGIMLIYQSLGTGKGKENSCKAGFGTGSGR